jgi:hypothetical protein
MMKKAILVFLAVLLLLPLAGQAHSHRDTGEWGGSGGEFIKDQNNPWFLVNTKQVSYCIEIDSAGFSAPPEKVRSLIEMAIQYWKGELAKHSQVLGVGIQDFVLKNNFPSEKCSGSEDLKIQFGYNTLSADQQSLFSSHDEDPADYVGVAVRTEYDKVNLKGRGFVFISSDRGPDPSHIYNHGVDVAPNLWTHDGLLFRILQHELGHVFGVTHIDHSFMSAGFPETMVKKFRDYRTIDSHSFFGPADNYQFCGSFSDKLSGVQCLNVSTADSWNNFDISGLDASGKTIITGQARNVLRAVTLQQFPLRAYLPKEQKVFSDAFPGETRNGPAREEIKLVPSVQWNNGKDNPAASYLLDLSADHIEIFGPGNSGVFGLIFLGDY